MADIAKSVEGVIRWLEGHEYRGYDPGDGQLSYLRALTFNQPFLRRVLTAVVLRQPFGARPLLGIRSHVSTKGMGYIAWGYTKRYAQTKQASCAERAAKCFEWLGQHRAPHYTQLCWGNNFAFTTRGGTIPALEPTIVWSSLIGQAYLEASRTFGEENYLEVAASIGDWILTLPREETATGSCLSYVAYEQSSIHNSNLLGAALLGQVGARTGNTEALAAAKQAVIYSCSRQNADGSWYYGEAEKFHWIDNFHTGYNLDSLRRYIESTGERGFQKHLERGLAYFMEHFIEADGRPRYYHDRAYPIDIQCAAQAIDTLCFFRDYEPRALELARQVADWTVGHMQAPDGHFYYRDLGWIKDRTPMLHWGQGTMFKALAHLAGALEREAGGREPGGGGPGPRQGERRTAPAVGS